MPGARPEPPRAQVLSCDAGSAPTTRRSWHGILGDYAQRVDRARGDTDAAAVAVGRMHRGPPSVVEENGLGRTHGSAGHADHLLPGHAGLRVEKRHADALRKILWSGDGRTDFPTVSAPGAARGGEVEVGSAAQLVVLPMQANHVRLTGCDARGGTVDAGVLQALRQSQARRRRPQREQGSHRARRFRRLVFGRANGPQAAEELPPPVTILIVLGTQWTEFSTRGSVAACET
jgi:hypothetical protein